MLRLRALTPADWPFVEILFGDRGACGGCWCMEWRRDVPGHEAKKFRGEANRTALRALVMAGEAQGVLAFADDTPVGWCSVGPHGSFPTLLRKRTLRTVRTPRSWAITCLFVRKDRRNEGVGIALAREAVNVALHHGADVVEAFPADVRGKKLPAPFVWTGTASLFRQAGFHRSDENPRVYVYARDKNDQRPSGRRTIW
jgi:GNAT superfamily N-acetyltransferase